jgi:SAM-dependent methyltransferase
LVRSASDAGIDAYGFDDGWAASLGREGGTRILDDTALEIYAGTFDFVSAIEVLEHVSDPLAALRKIRRLLKPNGILFVTTGNARPWRDNPLAWSYTSIPDVHVSFYEPETLETCLRKCGFRTDNFPSSKLFVDIIKFKILKTLRLKDRHWLIDVLPWKMIAAVVDKRHQVSRHPYGVAD